MASGGGTLATKAPNRSAGTSQSSTAIAAPLFARTSPGFGMLPGASEEHNRDVLHEILEAAAANKANTPGSIDQKIGDFYASGMDEAAVEKAGIAPLKEEFARIGALQRPAELSAELAHLQVIGVDAVFSLSDMQDFADSIRIDPVPPLLLNIHSCYPYGQFSVGEIRPFRDGILRQLRSRTGLCSRYTLEGSIQ